MGSGVQRDEEGRGGVMQEIGEWEDIERKEIGVGHGSPKSVS